VLRHVPNLSRPVVDTILPGWDRVWRRLGKEQVMTEVRRAVNAAARRLFMIDVLHRFTWAMAAMLIVAIVALVIDRLLGLMLPWWFMLPSVVGASVLIALGWAVITRRRTMQVAVTLDEAAGLRESLSTALSIEKSSDAWSAAVVETARQRAAGLKVRAVLPVTRPRFASAPLFLVVALAGLWFTLPNWDLLGRLEADQKRQSEQQKLAAVKAEVQAKDKKLEQLLAKAQASVKNEEGEKETPPAEKPEPQSAEEIQRAAVKKLTAVTEKLDQMKQGEKAQQFQAMKDAMRQLRQPGDGPLNEFARQMARGNFEGARQQLDELSKQLADGAMSDEQKQQAREQMKNLASQLDKLAKNTSALQNKLEQAGVSREEAKKLVQAPAGLQKALEQMSQLSPEQKQALMQMASSMAKSGQQMQAMSQGMQQMSQGMSQSGMDQQGMEGMEQMQGELSAAELMSSDMASLDAAMSEAQQQLEELGKSMAQGPGNQPGQSGQGGQGGQGQGGQGGQGQNGQWTSGNANQRGNGSGSAGRSNGGIGPEAQAADYTIEKTKAKVATKAGPIIGSRLVFGEQIKGESVAEFSQAVESGQQAASEAMETMAAPRELHDSIKHYFGTLDAKVKQQQKAKEGAPAAPPPPAAPAKDAGKK
jgi:hypothetical protein